MAGPKDLPCSSFLLEAGAPCPEGSDCSQSAETSRLAGTVSFLRWDTEGDAAGGAGRGGARRRGPGLAGLGVRSGRTGVSVIRTSPSEPPETFLGASPARGCGCGCSRALRAGLLRASTGLRWALHPAGPSWASWGLVPGPCAVGGSGLVPVGTAACPLPARGEGDAVEGWPTLTGAGGSVLVAGRGAWGGGLAGGLPSVLGWGFGAEQVAGEGLAGA